MGDAADERRNYYRVMEIGRRLLKVSRRILAGHSDRRADDWPHRDTDCDFRLFRRRLFVDAPLTSSSGVICVEMMFRFQQAGARFVQALPK